MFHTYTHQHAMHVHTHTNMCINIHMHSARTHVNKQLIAATFTQKGNNLQFLLTSIKWRIISANACTCEHTENKELDSHAACMRRKEKIMNIGKLKENIW